jgi:hypothetical protein
VQRASRSSELFDSAETRTGVIRHFYKSNSWSGHLLNWQVPLSHFRLNQFQLTLLQNIGIIAASLSFLSPLLHFFDDRANLKNISLPLERPPTPISKGNRYYNGNFSRPYRPEQHIDVESNAGPGKHTGIEREGDEVKIDYSFRESTQEFLLGMFPMTKSGMVRFGRNGRLKGDGESENEAWG